jgi:leucyl aminopeptidase
MEIKDYSDKSYIVFGETKQYKDELKDLGGKFNLYLKHPETSEVVAGWIFKKTDNLKDEIEKIEKGFYVFKNIYENKSDNNSNKKTNSLTSISKSSDKNVDNTELIILKNKIINKIESYENIISNLETTQGVETSLKEYRIRLDELKSLI